MVRFRCLVLCALLCGLCVCQASVCNVKDYGAKGDGVTNDTEPFIKALEACKGEPSTLYVPAGNYSVWPLVLDDTECTDLLFNLTGTLLAPSDPADYKWVKNVSYLLFKNCKNFTLHGSGTGVIDGRGQNWWELFKKHNVERPYLSILDDGEYLAVRDIILMDSPMFHLVPRGSKHILVEGVTIHAPSDSPNTDGIDPSDSEDVMILNCNISTGDDNVAVKGGCQGVLVQDCYFAYGHGCSIGSINTTGVQDVMLKNITFVGTENGARIKTWQGGTALVQNISYVSLRMEEVGYPILIDMYYCPGGGCKNQTKEVTIKDILFSDITGTQSKGIAGQLYCSDTVPCTHIQMQNIDLKAAHGDDNSFKCWRAFGEASNVSPPSCLIPDNSTRSDRVQ